MNMSEVSQKLKKCAKADKLDVASSILYGEVDMIVECAKRLLGKVPDFDVIFSAETRGTPLAYEQDKVLRAVS